MDKFLLPELTSELLELEEKVRNALQVLGKVATRRPLETVRLSAIEALRLISFEKFKIADPQTAEGISERLSSVYRTLGKGVDAFSLSDLMAVHQKLRLPGDTTAGKIRDADVLIYDRYALTDPKIAEKDAGIAISYRPPEPGQVEELIQYALDACKNPELQQHPMIVAGWIHAQILAIHPFQDSNGKVARVWEHLFLLQESKFFHVLPSEFLVLKRGKSYHVACRAMDAQHDTTPFIRWMLESYIHDLELLSHLLFIKPYPYIDWIWDRR